ncbi:hypothetical protein C8C83_0899 [Flavobacterium sp. 90]|uniref:hypothetical protein n=1 Tax=unclassified Flavobacterium TaxID=196869 RepID=UPI000EB48699|nr:MULTISPECIES: hypothetical protein [unclassified Flavobacterium]RKR09278.1 hypothetical protein C8C82_1199 [Flavobacterium sp. 81]TCK53062.1 hypothetical protein C8C83_0899 [Flavobacterium sp. 90]
MYQTIQNLPTDYQFDNKTKEELKLYEIWFKENKDDRINHLIELVKTTPSFEDWNADFTPNSLNELGRWFYQNVETLKLTEEEYFNKRSQIPNYIEIEDWDLSIKTRSLIVDIGLYFGEVFIHTHKELVWKQYFSKNKKDMNNGHMVIPKFGKLELNPILVIMGTAWGLARKKYDDKRLYDLYKIWENYL